MDYQEARKTAGELGIKTHGKKKEEIEQLIEAKNGETSVSALGDERKQEAKEARMGQRKRRGGALLGSGEPKLNRPELRRKGYQRRWFKNEPGRLDGAYANDWDFVKKDEQKVTLRDGTNKDGSLRTMFLMEKRADWYKEDQFKKREQDRKNEKLLLDGNMTAAGGAENAQAASQAMAGIQLTGGTTINSVIKQ